MVQHVRLSLEYPFHRVGQGGRSYEDQPLEVREKSLRAFDELPKPVLPHCSSGNQAISLVYAARIIQLGWQTRDPFNDDAKRLTKRATDNDMLSPNIVEMWGMEAIVTFFQYATDNLQA